MKRGGARPAGVDWLAHATQSAEFAGCWGRRDGVEVCRLPRGLPSALEAEYAALWERTYREVVALSEAEDDSSAALPDFEHRYGIVFDTEGLTHE